MRSSLSQHKHRGLRLLGSLSVALVALSMKIQTASASIFSGDGIRSAIGNLRCLGGISCATDIRALIVDLIKNVLDFVTLLGMITVIIAGIYLITSNGDEGTKDKAKKIILYTVLGIIIIVFSRVIVTFFASVASIA